nr:RHS repeat-associated core domain-containing protein [Tahibacter caeni]
MNLRYPGQYFDAETGLHYNYFRDYEPKIGRYAQADLIGLRGGIDLYGYASGSPLPHYDAGAGRYFEVAVTGSRCQANRTRGRDFTRHADRPRAKCSAASEIIDKEMQTLSATFF